MMTASPPVARIAFLRLPALLFMCVALLAVIVFVTDGVEGRTITVDDDGGADYEKIQDAINASEDGDTVRVYEGMYYENVVVNKSIDFVGNGSEITAIDGGDGDVVRITADWVNMSGFAVTGSGTSWQDSGIKVESGNNHIQMNNCSNNGIGIYIYRSDDSTITNNTCENNDNGIYLRESSDRNTIENNTCENNGDGIYLQDSSACTITNNTCSANSGSGIFFKNSNGNTLDNNNCSENNDDGISLEDSIDCKITNNTCSENFDYGINLNSSSACTITNNSCKNNRCGISLRYSSASTLTDNVCKNSDFGIYLFVSSACTLDNNTCSENNLYGIKFDSSSNCSIENNTCSENNYHGIYLSPSINCSIENNTCSLNNEYGIKFDSSSNCSIENNTCSENNGIGIYFYSSRDCTITNNTCSENNLYGIYFYSSRDCTITNNTCSANNYGIMLYKSNKCTITNTTILENRIGISLKSSSQDNTAHYNRIFDNTEYGISASDNNDYAIDARYNWWGSETGPYHPIKNPGVGEDNITDYVEFYPWFVDSWFEEKVNWPPEAYIDFISPNPAVEGKVIRFVGHGTGDDSIIGYVWRSSIDGEFYNGTEKEFGYSDLLQGEYTIYLKVLDNYGTWSDEVSTTLTITEYIPPNQKPSVTITSPANNTEISGTTTIAGNATDPDGIVEKVEISINGGVWITVTDINPWSYSWYSPKAENMNYMIRVRAYDGEDYSEIVVWNLKVEDEEEKPINDDDDSPGFSATMLLLGVLLLLALLSLLVFMGRSPREKGKPPVGKEESGGVDEGSKE